MNQQGSIQPSSVVIDQNYSAPSYDQLYQLMPLSGERSIRLLDLDGPGSAATMSGTMRVVDLKQYPKFTALSYVWGNTRQPHSLSCNGCSIPIPRSCFKALNALRQIYGAITIWIDAVCINQADLDEKARQIGLMAEIYTWSKAVYVWLGDADENTSKAMTFLSAGSTFQSAMIGAPWVVDGEVRTVRRDTFSLVVAMTLVNYKRIMYSYPHFQHRAAIVVGQGTAEDIKHLLQHEYIQRAWTFQELVLAPNPVIVCGTQTVPWSGLERILTRTRKTGRVERPGAYDPCREVIKSLESDTINAWLALLDTWTAISRPNRWHERTFRRIPRPEHESRCSIAEYRVTYLNICLIRVASDLSAFLLLCLTVGAPFYAVILVVTPLISFVIHISNDLRLLAVRVIIGVLSSLILVICFSVYKSSFRIPAPVEGSCNNAALLGILQTIREREAWEPRDKAFAVYGILDSLCVKHAPADYNKPVGKVYQDLFEAILRQNGVLLNLLLDVGPKLDETPSWVPDWSTLKERCWVKSEIICAPIHKSQSQIPSLEIGGNDLGVRASILGTITNTSSLFIARLNATDKDSADFQTSLSVVLSQFSRWVTAISQDVPVSSVYRPLANSILDALYARIVDIRPQARQVFPEWQRLLTREDGASDSPDSILEVVLNTPRLLHFTVDLCNMLVGKRSLFFSRKKHIGSGPPETLVGDEIVLLDGVGMPLILRETSRRTGTYNVIGAAFVCGYDDLLARVDRWDRITLI